MVCAKIFPNEVFEISRLSIRQFVLRLIRWLEMTRHKELDRLRLEMTRLKELDRLRLEMTRLQELDRLRSK